MAELSVGLIVTLCSIGVFTIVLIILYFTCRSKNKLYDHTCVAFLHQDEEKHIEAYGFKEKKKEAVVHVTGVTTEKAKKEQFLNGKNSGVFKEEMRNSTKVSRDIAKSASLKGKDVVDSKVGSRQETPLHNNNRADKFSEKTKQNSKKVRKPYEVEVQLSEQEPLLGQAPTTILRETSGHDREKCPLDDTKGTLRQSVRRSRDSYKDSRPSKDIEDPHYLRPKSFDGQTLSAKERREQFSRSHSDGVFKHYTEGRGRSSTSSRYMRPRSLDSQDRRPINDEHYVRPRSVGSRENQRSSYYDTPKTIERDARYMRPRSFDDNEKQQSYYSSPKERTDSYYVSPRTSEREQRMERSDPRSSYVHPRSPDKNPRDLTNMSPRKIENDVERAKLDLESYYKRQQSSSKDQGRDSISNNFHPRKNEKEHARKENYDIPRSFDKEDGKDTHYVKPRALDKDHSRGEHESRYDAPRSDRDVRDSYYDYPRTLDDRSWRHKDNKADMDRRGEKVYSSAHNVHNAITDYKDKFQRPRSTDRTDRSAHDLDNTQRSVSYNVTPGTSDVSARESRSRERERRGESERGRGNERRDVRDGTGRSRERKGQMREERDSRRNTSPEKYKTYGGKERKERERQRSQEKQEDARDGKERREKSSERRDGDGREWRPKEGATRGERGNVRNGRTETQRKEESRRATEVGRDRRERSNERFKVEREKSAKDEWLKGVERKSSRRRGRAERRNEDSPRRSSSLKRTTQDDVIRPRMRSHSLEDIPSTIERKKRQMHVIQRTKSWASRPSTRAESPSIPAQTIQLEFHPITGDVTPVDTKSEISSEPNSLTVESSPLLDYEWPVKPEYSDSQRSPVDGLSKSYNDKAKSFLQEKSSSIVKNNSYYEDSYTSKNPDSQRSVTPVNDNKDYRRSSSYRTYSDYSPHLQNNGDHSMVTGKLLFEYGTRKPPTDFTRSQDTQVDFYTQPKLSQERAFLNLNIVQNKADTFSKPKGKRKDTSTKPQATQTEVLLKPQGTQTDNLSRSEDSLRDLYTKAKENYPDFFSTSSYDSQSSTDDYRVYQNEVMKLKGRPRSKGIKKEAATSPLLEKRVQSDRVLELQARKPEETGAKQTPRSSVSSEDVDWHLYTVDGRKVIKPEVTHYQDLEWHSFTLSNERKKQNIVTQRKSHNTKYVTSSQLTNGTLDEMDDEVFMETPTVKRNESRTQGSVRENLHSRNLKNDGVTNSRNLELDLRRSSSQPLVYSFE